MVSGLLVFLGVGALRVNIPYRMKIFMEFNLATWLRLFKFMELNLLANFDFLIYELQ